MQLVLIAGVCTDLTLTGGEENTLVFDAAPYDPHGIYNTANGIFTLQTGIGSGMHEARLHVRLTNPSDTDDRSLVPVVIVSDSQGNDSPDHPTAHGSCQVHGPSLRLERPLRGLAVNDTFRVLVDLSNHFEDIRVPKDDMDTGAYHASLELWEM